MKAVFSLISLFLFAAVGALQASSAEAPGHLVIMAGNAPEPGCVAQLNDSSCRPDKFPVHNPDPAIKEPTPPKDKTKTSIQPEFKLRKVSVDCRFGSKNCFCTNRMAGQSARRLGLRNILIHGFTDRVLVSGAMRGSPMELVISRERTCPVIGRK
jgi:hypothetical protein